MRYKLAKIWAAFLKPIIVLGLVVYICIGLFIDINDTIRRSTLDSLKPESYKYLVDIAKDPGLFEAKKTRGYRKYYRKVTEFLPNKADAFGMLGFCSFHLGKHEEAIASYKKAIELNPTFFWFYHNLGLIYFKTGQYEESVAYLKKAVELDPKLSLMFMRSSNFIYMPIIIDNNLEFDYLKAQLKAGYAQAYNLLMLSLKVAEKALDTDKFKNIKANLQHY